VPASFGAAASGTRLSLIFGQVDKSDFALLSVRGLIITGQIILASEYYPAEDG